MTLEGSVSHITTSFQCKYHIYLKSDSHLPKKLCYLLHWKPFRNDEKYYFFYLESCFFLKIFKFLSWLFGHVGKMTSLEREG